jgi:hypothetical protein
VTRVRAQESKMTWTEDRALLGSTPSADPGAKTGMEWGRAQSLRPTSSQRRQLLRHSGIGKDAKNPRGTTPRSLCNTMSEPSGDTKTDLASRSSEKEDHHKCETFYRNPAGNQSRSAVAGPAAGSESCVVAGNRPCEA